MAKVDLKPQRIKMMFRVFTLLSLQYLAWASPIRRIWKRDAEGHEVEDDSDKPIVFITISSLASDSSHLDDRLIELNWERLPSNALSTDARVNLYNSDPMENASEPLESVRPLSSGYFRTSVRFPEQVFTRDNLTNACLNYWIAYKQNGEILSSNCLRAHPNWMYEARSVIGNLSLMDLMIPGTHNTGTYAPFEKEDDTIFNRYLITQEENIWHQLVYGIRYLDLRVAYRTALSSPEKLWITHGSFVTDITVKEVIQQVKKFLDSTNEIVIMDFHRFVNGFKGKSRATRRHQELIALLEEELMNYAIPVSFTSWASLNTLWASGKRLYIGYADESARRQSSVLFPAIKHLWADVDFVGGLKQYLNQTVCSQRNRRLTSAMAQLTPTTTGAIFDTYGGLRTMADDVNRHVTRWFRDKWSHCANIVATDFFLGNNIIEVAIEVNKRKQLQ